jgi:hypothetical protein
MTMANTEVHELAGGDIAVWQDENGVIHLKCQEKYGDPVELGEEEALELAELLTRLVKNAR